ncbi:MAG: ArsR family transcriptional regulator [Candidatus ainarchaeum sp.]|nr:ArsR family transcriptional regulator [Candidatus ainarchaeum sp.]
MNHFLIQRKSALEANIKNENQDFSMEQYKEIHIWDFPPTKTCLRIKEDFRRQLIRRAITCFGSWRRTIGYINTQSKIYGLERKLSVGAISHWARGIETTSRKTRNIPLWAVLEISKVLSEDQRNNNDLMKEIEENLEYFCAQGKGISVKTKFPMRLTPEVISVIFHLCGDGHLANKDQMSHYRQVNKIGLENFVTKLRNSFGDFYINENDLNNAKAGIPRIIAEFYRHYFKLNSCYWDVARIPEEVKNMPKDFLVAGLTSFIIDEGHIGDQIEIYSGNKKLLSDIQEIAQRLEYICNDPKEKIARGRINGYRINISPKSAIKLYEDILVLKKKFPTCDLAHKMQKLENIVKIKTRIFRKHGLNETKKFILELLSRTPMTATELSEKLTINASSLRDHLRQLEEQGTIFKKEKLKHSILWGKIA